MQAAPGDVERSEERVLLPLKRETRWKVPTVPAAGARVPEC
jgi:hypothetical protein